MVFSSLFFVFFFLALNLIAYHFADGIKRKNMVLLGFSLVFYSWGGPKYLLLLLSMVFASWLFALLIDQYREEGQHDDANLDLSSFPFVKNGFPSFSALRTLFTCEAIRCPQS